jgi:hypothetical protein
MTNAIRLGKKTFTWSVVVMTILWSMGVAALVPTVVNAQAACPTLEAGDLFKVPNNSAVYLLNADMERLYFPHATVYKTWYEDYSGVVEIPNTCVDAYPAPSSAPFGVNYRPGSTLVKVQISPSVYVVETGNKKSKLGSEAVARSLYGDNWASKVMDIADVFWPNYTTTGDEITEAVPHNGMLVKTSGSSNVYHVVDGELVMVDGTPRGDVQTVAQSVMDSLSMGSSSVTASSIYADPTQGAGGVGTGTGTGTTPGTAAGTLTVSLASDTPSGSYVYAAQARAPFTKVNFTASGGDVVIKTLKVRRGGVGVDADFSRINVVKPDGNLLNEAGKTLNADHLVSFSEDITISSGMTKSYWLVADMAAAGTLAGGNVPTLDVYEVETDSTVVGSFPLNGNPVSTNGSVTLGTATVTEGAQVGTVTKRVGETGVNLANLQIDVNTQNGQVERVTLYNSGTASSDDFDNVHLTYNNAKIADGEWDGKYVSFDLTGCGDDCKITKGNNKQFAVYGDVLNGTTRNMNLDVKRASHVLVKELNSNVYVLPTNSATGMTNTVQVGAGTLNITKVNNVPAGNIPEAANGIELGSWNFRVTGESVDVSTLVFEITTAGTGAQPADITNLTLYNSSGASLMSGVDGVGAAVGVGYATSTDTITFPVGDNIVTLKGNINSDPANGDTVTIAIDQDEDAANDSTYSNFAAAGVDSGDDYDLGTSGSDATQEVYPGNSDVSANTRTITTAALRVTTLSSPPAQTFAAGTNSVLFAKVQLDATGSSEDIKITQFKVRHSSTAQTNHVQNIRLWVDKDGDSHNGSGTVEELSIVKAGSNTSAGSEDYTFNLSGSDQFTIAQGKKLIVEVRGDLSGGATAGTHNIGVSSSNFVTAIGVDTNNTVNETIDTATGNLMTVGTSGGSLEVALDSSNPTAKLFAGGTQGATLAVFNFLATTTEDIEVERVKFTQVVTDTVSSSYLDYDLLYLEDESGVVVGSVIPTSTTPVIEFGTKEFVVSKSDADGQKMYLKANLSSIGSGENVTVGGHQLGYKINAKTDIVAKGSQTGSGSIEYFGTAVPTGLTNYMYKGLPTITKLAVGGTLTNGTNDLYKFKVTANTSDIDVYKFTFDITTTTAKITSVEFLDITEDAEVSLYSANLFGTKNEGAVANLNVLLDDDNPSSGDGGEAETVSVGTPRTFVLRGTVTGAASGASISTRMGGDAAAWSANALAAGYEPSREWLTASSTPVDASLHDDFIWSDRHLSAHATTTNDWVNGYLVTGLNSASTTPTVVAL